MIIRSLSFLLLFFITVTFVHGQQEIKGKIIDVESNTPLADVHILNLSDSAVVLSNFRGEFTIAKIGNYKFSRLGYQDRTIKMNNDGYSVIQMHIKSTELNEVIVGVNSLPQRLKRTPATISIVSQKDIEAGNSINVAPILNKVPGIYMHTGALNTNRITIRGIGSRNLFGTAKIRAYFEDIPLTTGNGETTIEDFELNTIARLEIIKGANSSIYGGGLGGTIHLIPKKSYLDNKTIISELSVGSFGFRKGTVGANFGGPKQSVKVVYSNTYSDGYRDNNEYDRQTVTVTSSHFLNDKNELSFVGSYVDLKAFIPSSINEDAFANDPSSAAFTWGRSKGFEDAKRGIFGISWKHQYSSNLKQHTSVFTSFRNAYEPRPFNILSEETFAMGVRSRLIGKVNVFKQTLDWTFGGELFNDTHSSKTFENLYQDFPVGTGSVKGVELSNFKERRSYVNLFFETNYHLSEKTLVSIGLNFNQTKYNLNDRFNPIGNIDQSGDYSFDGTLSPKIGVSHMLSDDVTFYGTISHGFSPPSISETLLPDGLINTDIQPETGWNYEIGSRGSLYNNRLQFGVAVFRLDVRNLLVARRAAQDQFIGINAGKTQHDGVEVSLRYNLMHEKPVTIDSYISYTLNDFIFKEFVDEGEDFSGNDLTGVPSKIFNAGLEFNSDIGIYANINFQYVGSIPITDANSVIANSYSLTNMKLGYKVAIKKIELGAFIGLNNIFDEEYASQLLINAGSFGGNAPRYFYPGNPLNYYTGIHINYSF
jgi:iron complex outermembrane receptor protein